MYYFLTILFVFVCILMVVTILLQASKGGGLATSFGGMGGGGGVLGSRGATSFLQKTTIGLAIFYGVLCLLISLLSKPAAPESKTQQSLQNEQQALPPVSAPVVPGNVQKTDAQNSQDDNKAGTSDK